MLKLRSYSLYITTDTLRNFINSKYNIKCSRYILSEQNINGMDFDEEDIYECDSIEEMKLHMAILGINDKIISNIFVPRFDYYGHSYLCEGWHIGKSLFEFDRSKRNTRHFSHRIQFEVEEV